MKQSGYILGSLLIVVVTLVLYNSLTYSDFGMQVLGVVGIVQFAYSIFSWKKVTGSALNPYMVFLFSAYVFTFGQSFLNVFGKVTDDRALTEMFLPSSIMPAQYLTLIFLNFFHIGGLLSCKKHNQQNAANSQITLFDEQNRCNQVKGIRKAGRLFIIVSIIPYIVERVTIFYIVLVSGYGGIYEQQAKVGIFNIISILSQYFIPGVLCLLLVETSRRKKWFYIAILLAEIGFWLYTGGRSNGVIIASVLLLYYHICVKPIRLKQAIIIGIAGFFFVSTLGIISETRSASKSDMSAIVSDNMGSSNAFYSALSEMGGSMYPMITTMTLVPDRYDYKYGSSYFYSLTSVIPNLGFWDLHPAMKYGNMNDWLQDAMDLNYGPGFSIVAEAYINFGSLGFLMMLVLGYCFGLIFNINIRDKYNPLLLVLSFVFCFLIIKTVRNSFLATVRSVFYYILPIYLIVVYMYKGRINRKTL